MTTAPITAVAQVPDAPCSRRRLTDNQRRLFELLRASDGDLVEERELVAAAGLKPSSWRAYYGKRHYQGLLEREASGRYRVTLPRDFSELEFLRQTTQSAELREVGGLLCEPLARSLIASTGSAQLAHDVSPDVRTDSERSSPATTDACTYR